MKRRIALLIEEKATVYGGRVSNSLDVAQAIVTMLDGELDEKIKDLTSQLEMLSKAYEAQKVVEGNSNDKPTPWAEDSRFHLCNHCAVNDYPTCGEGIIMAGDANEELTGADADRVIACSSFVYQHPCITIDGKLTDEEDHG